ncbi:hypothetical protein SD70_26340 [Gordoniibacillus kamchatkensis]|uniref:Uncharacterized protein n=1 Tax=Gordoniibacillus kamchatkensis TaxID=1590651 RepID=A0ABR5ABU7_9BACL|nr:hypothetical protein [Paenibacillus sp. VKM B-2647]KIL38435.1 hypothetical protein SD70_26340 [Paenibacillus sp. VKM B-2647]
MLIAILIFVILICALLLFSLRYARTVLHPAEIVVNWLMFGAVSEHWYYVIALLWHLIYFDKNLIIMSIIILTEVILIPSLFVWALFSWFNRSLSAYQKTMMIAWWFILASGAKYALHALGLTTYVRWHQGMMLADEFSRLIATLAFAHLYRNLLRREGNLR